MTDLRRELQSGETATVCEEDLRRCSLSCPHIKRDGEISRCALFDLGVLSPAVIGYVPQDHPRTKLRIAPPPERIPCFVRLQGCMLGERRL